jgi:starch phosphorylase
MRKKYSEEHTTRDEQLRTLAYNLWWTWNPEAQEIFRSLSPRIWEESNHNPVAVLQSLSTQELHFRLADRTLAHFIAGVWKDFTDYLNQKRTWARRYAIKLQRPVAYFSTEFGLHESLPIYSGGLGVLSGDHIKSASDLGLPFVGIGLFYRQGYFRQHLSANGEQREDFPSHDPETLPMELVVNKEGGRLLNTVEIGTETIYFQTWRMVIGRIPLYLFDTEIPENDPRHQKITAQVYGGDTTTRIAQEIVLGIGGIRFLRSMRIEPALYHMNEGHSAFLTFELLREELCTGKSPEEAESSVRSQCLFTTHTPVPAGHDRFSPDLMRTTFQRYWSSIPLDESRLLSYGRVNSSDPNEPFTMTVLALRMSRFANGVSKLHGAVSRKMWSVLYPSLLVDQVPIGSITNGIHTPSWASPYAHQFWNRRLGADWTRKLLDKKYWAKIENDGIATDEELWGLRYTLRRELLEFVMRRLERQELRPRTLALSPDALTICFARRFATYKRAPLLFRHLEEVLPLFQNPQRPIQLIFSGKAHPRDAEGKQFIRKIADITRHPALEGKVILLEDYDMNVARTLVSGADVWLNTPRRPLEASGTSGMKVLIHGGVNVSIMDGWWREAYDGRNGWAIGNDSNDTDMETQDEKDFHALIETLRNHVIPEFYDRRDDGLPEKWIARIRHSMTTLLPVFNTERMVAEYAKKYYVR